MATTAPATILEYDEFGASKAKPVRLRVRLCTGADPQIFEVTIPDKRKTRLRSLVFSRAQIEKLLSDNPE